MRDLSKGTLDFRSEYRQRIDTIDHILHQKDVCWFTEEQRKDFEQQLQRIKKRLIDPKLYIAMVGDFNAGKSTFLNRMVKFDVLKTANRAATSIPTLLSVKPDLREPEMWVTLNGSENSTVLRSPESIEKFASSYGRTLPSNLKECIAAITTGENWTDVVERVKILVPGSPEYENIAFIDTPGVNAAGEANAKHESRTTQVLREEADTVLLIVQGGGATFGRRFSEFVRNNAKKMVKNAILVVNAMDQVDEDEREDLLRYVQQACQAGLKGYGAENITVYSCSSLYAGRDPYWTQVFQDVRGKILENTAKCREKIIRERLADLTSQILEQMLTVLKKRSEDLSHAESVLAKHTLPERSRLEEKTDREIRANYESALSIVRRDWESAASQSRSSVLARVESDLKGMTRSSQIKSYAKSGIIQKLYEYEVHKLWHNTSSALESACNCYSTTLDGYRSVLQSEYDEVISAEVRVNGNFENKRDSHGLTKSHKVNLPSATGTLPKITFSWGLMDFSFGIAFGLPGLAVAWLLKEFVLVDKERREVIQSVEQKIDEALAEHGKQLQTAADTYNVTIYRNALSSREDLTKTFGEAYEKTRTRILARMDEVREQQQRLSRDQELLSILMSEMGCE